MSEEKKLSKKELSKLKKKEQKAASKEAEPEEVETEVPVPVGDETQFDYGLTPLIMSQRTSTRTFSDLSSLNPQLEGQSVWVRARVFTSRSKGNSCFIVLRQGFYSVQAALFKSESIPKVMVKFAASISKESVVDILGSVVTVAEPITSTSQSLVELSVKKIFVISAANVPPIQVEDCIRPETAAEDSFRPTVHLKTRLDNRFLDLRAPVNLGIFRIQSGVCCLFREFLVGLNFTEIHTPKILGTASEGGADVFKVTYFGGVAYLAQSPQLYKQMAVNSDMERVFEIGSVFRAENSNTPRHLTEFVGLDMEMTFKEHYYEVLGVINEMFKYIFNGLEQRFPLELKLIRESYPSEPITFGEKFLIISFKEGVRMLREAGEELPDLEDISTPHEKKLGALVKQRFGTDFYAMDRYPVNARPFYTMPCPDDPNYTNSYDLFLRGQEISSGAQRIHDPDLLIKVAQQKGVDLTPIQMYVDNFKYGSFPHGGCGIGLERVVMLYLGLHDIRKSSMFPRDPTRTVP